MAAMLRAISTVLLLLGAAHANTFLELPELEGRKGPDKVSCYTDAVRKKEIKDYTPDVPKNMCNACLLDTANLKTKKEDKNGGWRYCNKIFKIGYSDCKTALKEYVDKNPKHTDIDDAYDVYYNQKGSKSNIQDAGETLDRLLYVTCEFCCDCIPCAKKNGPAPRDFTAAQIKKMRKQGDKSVALIKADRANCPAHVVPDNCDIFPNLTVTFKSKGQNKTVNICKLSREFNQGKLNKRSMKARRRDLVKGLKKMTNNYGCKLNGVWDACREMEDNFGRLGYKDPKC